MLTEDIRDSRAWQRQDVSPGDWLVSLPQRCVEELDTVARQVRRDPLPAVLLSPEQFSLAACGELMGRVPFPRIGELPYLLTLGPHSFYWFQLVDQ